MKIPQAIVTLSPDGDLQVEQSIHGVRHLIPLGQASAGKQLFRLLMEQRKKLEGQAREARKRAWKQPQWELIAKHPQVEIRRLLAGPGLTGRKAGKSLEEMGL